MSHLLVAPRPALALKICVAVELVAQTLGVFRLVGCGFDPQALV